MRKDMRGVGGIFEGLRKRRGEELRSWRWEGVGMFRVGGFEWGKMKIGVVMKGEGVGGELKGGVMVKVRMRGED